MNTKLSSINKLYKHLLRFVLGVIFIVALSGCTVQKSEIPMNYRWASVEGSQLQEVQAGEQFYFNIPVDEGIIADGIPVKIKVSGVVNNGSMHFELRAPGGQPVWRSGEIGVGDFTITTEYPLQAEKIGTYTLGLVYDANTTASYNLSWHALKLGPVILLPGIGMIVVALAFLLYAVCRKLMDWRYLTLGALFWGITVAVKFLFAAPVSPLVYQFLGASSDALFSPGNLVTYVYIGALTGIFEAGLAWLILSKIRLGKASWNQALVFGIGFGGVEALLLGLFSLVAAVNGLIAPDMLPVPTLGNLANSSGLMGLAPVVERLSVIFAHIFSCVLIFHAVSSGEKRWGWLAIVYKTLLDAPAGFAAFWGSNTLEKIWTLEGIITFFGLIGLLGTLWIARRYPEGQKQ